MSDITDDDGNPVFTDEFIQIVRPYGDTPIDVIKTNGNLWLSGPQVMEEMGMISNGKGDHSRRLRRIDHPDIIKITETPFRFTDGRRNRGSLISPRAVLKFAEGGTQGFNPFKALSFAEWMKENVLLDGLDAEAWSPARKAPVSLEPMFHSVIIETDENEAGEPRDPLRPYGVYHGLLAFGPIQEDEVVLEYDGFGGRVVLPKENYNSYDDLTVVDREDDFMSFPKWRPMVL